MGAPESDIHVGIVCAPADTGWARAFVDSLRDHHPTARCGVWVTGAASPGPIVGAQTRPAAELVDGLPDLDVAPYLDLALAPEQLARALRPAALLAMCAAGASRCAVAPVRSRLVGRIDPWFAEMPADALAIVDADSFVFAGDGERIRSWAHASALHAACGAEFDARPEDHGLAVWRPATRPLEAARILDLHAFDPARPWVFDHARPRSD